MRRKLDSPDWHPAGSILYRIAACELFGLNQPVILHLVDNEPAMPVLQGVVMELDDCAFPLLKGLVATANLDEGFRGIIWALLVGSAASAANAALDSVRSITRPTAAGDWHSVCVCSDGTYGIDARIICSFSVRSNGQKHEIVPGLPITPFSRGKIGASVAELKEERAVAAELGLLPK
jgi:malate/lactate dehydrogenase